MAPEKAPAFQFYPGDFLSDPRVMAMTLEQRGAYITLICICWTETAFPMDVRTLSRLLRCTEHAFTTRIWPALQACFQKGDDGLLRQKRVEAERAKQAAYRQAQKDRAEKRWQSHGTATALPAPASSGNALPSSVSHLPSSISDLPSPKEQERVRVFRSSPPDKKSEREAVSLEPDPDDPDVGERASWFVSRYGELYQQHRNGARYLPRPALDYEKAKELCAVWPSARLERLAIVFLKTDHDFAASGSRTIGQFAALASWCDDRLTEVEKAKRA